MRTFPYRRAILLLAVAALVLATYIFWPPARLAYRIYSFPFWPPSLPTTEQDIEYLPTPTPLKALYMTARVGANPRWREKLTAFIEERETNAVVIDVRDISGRTFFELHDAEGRLFDGVTNRYGNIEALVADLNQRGIYTIGRICIFKDRRLAERRPEWTVRNKRDGSVWRDYTGDAWLEPGARPVWARAAETALAAHRAGFDEINFDYIRYPSDGEMEDAAYPLSGARTRREVMREGFALLDSRLRDKGIVTSISIFGMVLIEPNDLGIGQYLEDLARYFDFICPMTYPSHYPTDYLEQDDATRRTYALVKHSLVHGVDRLAAIGMDPARLRPWLQDFDYPYPYEADMVRAQIRAVYETGLDSWMMWNSRSAFTRKVYASADDVD